ncbi:MAG: FecR domain-containing protein [Candidatus Gracilibacteria bacterium]|nr:FecR domain-containing protein [Candidatus Gracilibacteria bacterium]
MKKRNNKFIIFIISLLLLLMGGLFSTFFETNEKLHFALLREGEANLERDTSHIPLSKESKTQLVPGDIIHTLGKDSLVTIAWGDGSMTRLGGDSSLRIDTAIVSNDLSEIKISFELLSGKTWSNVTSFFGEESYFIETFNDHEAAVRGTTFDVDTLKQYIYVTNHEVLLSSPEGEKIVIGEKKPFSLEDFSFITLLDFIKNYKDQSWQDLNKKLDKLQLEELKKIIAENLQGAEKFLELEKLQNLGNPKDYLSQLSGIEQQELYKKLLQEYQNIHFANSDTPDLLGKKLELKEWLLLTANEENKKLLMQSIIYDVKEVIQLENPFHFEKILDILSENNDILEKLNTSFGEIIQINKLSDELTLVIHSKLDNLKEFISETDFSKIPELSIEKLKKLQNSTDESFQKFMNSNINVETMRKIQNSTGDNIKDTFNSLFQK